MNDSQIDAAVELAGRAAERTANFKSETFLAILLAALMSEKSDHGRASLPDAASSRVTSDPPLQKPPSAGELFAASDWNTEIDKVVLAGSFLERYASLPNYTTSEVRNCLASAKVSPPKNVNLAIFQAVQRGWMMEARSAGKGSKTWELTQTGQSRAIEMARAK